MVPGISVVVKAIVVVYSWPSSEVALDEKKKQELVSGFWREKDEKMIIRRKHEV